MTLIGIALCGFLLLALVSTEAGRKILKIGGVLGIVIVLSGTGLLAYELIAAHQETQREEAAAAALAADPRCHDPQQSDDDLIRCLRPNVDEAGRPLVAR